METRHLSTLALCIGLGATTAQAAETDATVFEIKRFDVRGSTLLSPTQIEAIVGPYVGRNKGFGDIQMAIDDLQRANRQTGYGAIAVTLPEQEITAGVVGIDVIEPRLSRVSVQGNQHFSADNIRNGLPHLRPGEMPHSATMARQAALSNENPAKNVGIVLKLGEKRGDVEAEIQVEDKNPQRVIVSLDNTGMGSAAGDYRLGVAYQHANLFDRDHVLTAQYTTSPDHLDDVRLFNLGYHIPFYPRGHSLDLFAGHSSIDGGSSQFGGQPLSFSGSGDIVGLRYNQHLRRLGEYEHKLAYGWDWKAYDNTCSFGIFGSEGCGAAARDVTARPLGLTYMGTWTRPGAQTLLTAGFSHNLSGGKNGGDADYALARPSADASEGADADFDILRLGVSHLQVLPRNWQLRASLNGQFTQDALIPGEQFGLAGANMVRGFNEREVTRDRGYLLNLELFSPDLGKRLAPTGASLRGLVFYDLAHGNDVRLSGDADAAETLASVGLGLRVGYKDNFTLKLDLANVVDAGGSQGKGDWKAHLLMTTIF